MFYSFLLFCPGLYGCLVSYQTCISATHVFLPMCACVCKSVSHCCGLPLLQALVLWLLCTFSSWVCSLVFLFCCTKMYYRYFCIIKTNTPPKSCAPTHPLVVTTLQKTYNHLVRACSNVDWWATQWLLDSAQRGQMASTWWNQAPGVARTRAHTRVHTHT